MGAGIRGWDSCDELDVGEPAKKELAEAAVMSAGEADVIGAGEARASEDAAI
jgi:hypothetical protein